MSAFAQDGQHEGGFWKKLGRRVTPQIQVVNPLHYVSYEDQGHVMTIKNGTRLFCKVVAYGSVITLDDEGRPSPLAPAEGVADVRHYEPLSPSIPLVAQCYENASMETYAGTATHTLQLNPGNPEALEWTIQESEVETPQGQSASGTLRPTPDAYIFSRDAIGCGSRRKPNYSPRLRRPRTAHRNPGRSNLRSGKWNICKAAHCLKQLHPTGRTITVLRTSPPGFSRVGFLFL